MPTLTLSALALSVFMAVAAGLIGCFVVMRRMTLAADALSHIALPGIGVALALHLHPIAGALALLFLGTLLIWGLEGRTRIATETVVGVVFSVALAIGSIVTSGEDLIDALLGEPTKLSSWEVALGLGGAAGVVAFVVRARHRLVVSMVSPDIALTAGIDVRRLNLAYLLAFALTVALGLRFLGVLLMGSLIIIPAATARRLAKNLTGMFALSVAVAVFSTVAGTSAAAVLHRTSGPFIAAVAGALFLLSLLWRGRPAG